MNTKQKIKKFIWLITIICIGILSAFIITKAIGYSKIENKNNKSVTQENTQLNKTDEKKDFYFIKNINNIPKITASSYIVGDLDTGEVIIKKNASDIYPIASVSKMMTAYVANEINSSDEIAKVTNRAIATYGENGNLRAGEKIKVNDLIYPLLLESSNDAAEVIAEHFKRDEFLSKMNLATKNLSLENTSFDDPSGLSRNNISTATDLFKFTGYLFKNHRNILDMTLSRSYKTSQKMWFSINQFLREDGYIGGKSGFTNPAKQTVVSAFSLPLAETANRNIGIALLQSNDRYNDVKNIVRFLKENVYYGGEDDANTAWVKQKEDAVDLSDPSFVKLAFVGDIMLDRGVRNSVMKNFDGDFSSLFNNLKILKNSDIVFGNLEGPASDKGVDSKNLYSFRMNPSVVPALKGAGFDVLSLANNHIADWGREAFIDTMNRLKENEIYYIGAGFNETEAETPVIIEKYNIKIGYLAFTDKGPNHLKAGENPGILLASNPRFKEIIKNASTQVDHLVVSFHFGEEYKKVHDKRQEFLAHTAIDNGARIIIGHHPHVTQDFEVYKNGFIAYSLGNFIFDQYFSEDTMQGTLLEIKLDKYGLISNTKNTVKLSRAFQPEKVILGKEERIKFSQ
jgi:poly-gamma-glutamate synthesis protein (capsule biosynthesis protein)